MKDTFIYTPAVPINRGKRKAFALVLSLALMGFMVLLIVTLATMVQMQMRLSNQSLNDFRAKQAAKFAAYQALSRVQSALGPDQRITANAMMFDDSVATQITALDTDSKYTWWSNPMNIDRDEVDRIDDASISQNRFWVGVWDSRIGYAPEKQLRSQPRLDYVTKTVEKALTWLVSGNGLRPEKSTDYSIVKYKPTAKLDDGKYVRAVASGSFSDEYGAARSDMDVMVPLVALDKDPNPVTGEVMSDGRQTRIAWWVSDEAQKASLNAVAARDFIEHAQRIEYRVQSLPFYSGIHGLTIPNIGGKAGVKAFDLNFDDTDDDSSSIARIRNLNDVKQLDIFRSSSAPATTQLAKIFFHSASFNTKGLLVNVRDGGMKKDLTLGLTRKDFDNETEELTNNENNTGPEYFERPYGVSGYDYKTTAYPLLKSNVYNYHIDPTKSGEPDRKLEGNGHIFGPQMYGHENIPDAENVTALSLLSQMFSDDKVWKDPGGPLWDQLRTYYNLRAEDLASKDTINPRAQTDDRFGLKPVVKRFQVFYVPTFVSYGNNRYGLRLHIIPLLVLYNPYDTKIMGDTYYALRIWGQSRHQTGTFRFAIGYRSGSYFQCARDVRTELMPSMSNDIFPGANNVPNSLRLRQFMLPIKMYANWKATTQNNYSPSPMVGSETEVSATQWFMSRKTKFYSPNFSFLGTNSYAIPLGYGGVSACDFQNIPSNQTEHWKGIVSEANLMPDFTTARNRNAGVEWTARVAKVPLYLNSIYMSADHGVYNALTVKTDSSSTSYLFYGQRAVDALNPQNAAPTSGPDGNLRFLAYDAKGIEPGKAKIFCMTRIVNYIGNSSNSSTTASDGPNGNLEGNSSVSVYESKKAMLRGMDDDGVFGGCFYIDVPHPEAEHAAKFNGDLDWQYNTTYGKYILLDLSLTAANANNLKDINGTTPPTSISNYYIDMQDVEGWPSSMNIYSTRPGGALGAVRDMTPMGYGLYSFPMNYVWTGYSDNMPSNVAQYWSPQHRNQYEYIKLNLDVWIWKREGFQFKKFSNNSSYGTDGDGTHIMGPSIAYYKGYRFFLYLNPSFPDPSTYITNDTKQSVGGTDVNMCYRRNFHTWGFARSSGGTTCALRAYYNFSINSSSTDQKMAANGITTPAEEYTKYTDAANMQEIDRTRYFINWLAINPRRHSANYWAWYNGDLKLTTQSPGTFYMNNMPGNIMDYIGDSAPKATLAGTSYIPSYNSYTYHTQLHASIKNTQGYVPYGYIFAQTYAYNPPGIQPFFNRRLFVNNTSVATSFDYDYCGQEFSLSGETAGIYNVLGKLCKTAQAFSQVYATEGDGMTEIGYDVGSPDSAHLRVGLKPTIGTTTAPISHILRKTEIVSNPANLAGANFSFGVGQYQGSTYKEQGDGLSVSNQIFQRSYSIQAPDSLSPQTALGNSLAHSRISPERAYQIRWLDGASQTYDLHGTTNKDIYNGKRDSNGGLYYGDRNVLYDMSWLLNDALWDEYFFSTLPYRKDEASNTFDTEYAYPQNPRLQYAVSNREDYLTLKDLTATGNEDQFEQNAPLLWVNGPFNVNSTSVDAWKAVLSTYYGQTIKGYDGNSVTASEKAAFHRWAAPFVPKMFTRDNSADEEDTSMQGFRALDDEEIEELAIAIVENIKDRGPFYSMSNFVNRVVADLSAEERYTDWYVGEKLVPLPDKKSDRENLSKEYLGEITYRMGHAQKGVLQAAIDATSINSAYHTDEDTIISVDNDRNMSDAMKNDENYKVFKDPTKLWENWRGAIGPQATGAPTYLMQQDILARIGSFLTVRSDTFKIRAYGEIRNPISGSVEGKAWCEMIVQRLPEYMDTDSQNQEAWRINGREYEIGYQGKTTGQRNYNAYIEELSDLNKALGRRFKIVSFRWLNSKEI